MLALLQAATSQPSFLAKLGTYLTLGATGIITEEATPLMGGLAAQTMALACVEAAGFASRMPAAGKCEWPQGFKASGSRASMRVPNVRRCLA